MRFNYNDVLDHLIESKTEQFQKYYVLKLFDNFPQWENYMDDRYKQVCKWFLETNELAYVVREYNKRVSVQNKTSISSMSNVFIRVQGYLELGKEEYIEDCRRIEIEKDIMKRSRIKKQKNEEARYDLMLKSRSKNIKLLGEALKENKDWESKLNKLQIKLIKSLMEGKSSRKAREEQNINSDKYYDSMFRRAGKSVFRILAV